MKCGVPRGIGFGLTGAVAVLLLGQSAGAQSCQDNDEFALVCDQDPAPWIEFYTDRVYDLDGDGALDRADRCMDNPVRIRRQPEAIGGTTIDTV